MLALMLTSIIQISGYAVDDVWGGMGLTEDAVQQDSNYANTVFDKYTDFSKTPAPNVNNGKYPTGLTETKETVSASDTEKRTIKKIEFYGLNSVSQDELLEKMQMKQGGTYSRDLLQADLKTIYETGFFTENMKAIPSKNDDGSVTLKGIPEKAINMPNFAIVTTGSNNEFTIIAEESSSNLSGTATISGEMFGTGFYAGNVRFVFYGNSPNDSDAIVSPAFDYVSDLNQLKTEEKIGRQSYSVSIPVSGKLGLSDSDITVSGISDAAVSKKLEGNNLVISIGAGELISRTAYRLNVSFNVPSYGKVTRLIDFTTGSFAGKYEWNYDSSHQFAVIVEDSPAGSDVNYYVYTSPDDNKYNNQKLRLNPLYIKDSDLPDGGVSYPDAPEAYKWNNSKWNTSGIDPSRLSDIRTTIISRDYVSAEVDSEASGFSVTTTTSVEFKETENTCYMIFYNYITGGDSLGVSFGRPALVSNPNPDSSKFETSSYHFALSYQGS